MRTVREPLPLCWVLEAPEQGDQVRCFLTS